MEARWATAFSFILREVETMKRREGSRHDVETQ